MIAFDEATHTYTVDGKRRPSVSEIIRPLTIDEYEHVPRDQLEAAAAFGTHVHKACHLFNMGRLNVGSVDAAIMPYLAAWQTFLHESGFLVQASELRVYSQEHGYCGTLDNRGLMPRRRVRIPAVVDIKTSATVPRSVGPQTMAYAKALNSAGIARYCVHLKPDGKFKLIRLEDSSRDWNTFVSCLNIWRWKNS